MRRIAQATPKHDRAPGADDPPPAPVHEAMPEKSASIRDPDWCGAQALPFEGITMLPHPFLALRHATLAPPYPVLRHLYM